MWGLHLHCAPCRGGVGVRQQDRRNRIFVDAGGFDCAMSMGQGDGRAGQRVSGNSGSQACKAAPDQQQVRASSEAADLRLSHATPHPACPHTRTQRVGLQSGGVAAREGGKRARKPWRSRQRQQWSDAGPSLNTRELGNPGSCMPISSSRKDGLSGADDLRRTKGGRWQALMRNM